MKADTVVVFNQTHAYLPQQCRLLFGRIITYYFKCNIYQKEKYKQ